MVKFKGKQWPGQVFSKNGKSYFIGELIFSIEGRHNWRGTVSKPMTHTFYFYIDTMLSL